MDNITQDIYRLIDKISREHTLNADTAEELYYLLQTYLFEIALDNEPK